MSWDDPVQILVRELTNTIYSGQLDSELTIATYCGQLGSLRRKLGISSSDLGIESLSRQKKPCLTYKLTEWKKGLQCNYEVSWVVKFSPKDKQDNPWYDVYQEYRILTAIDTQANIPIAKPIHCSSEAERGVVGTKFIIMSFVEGKSYESASNVPDDKRETAFSSVMRELANVHRYRWVTGYDRHAVEHTRSDTFWQEQISCWKDNYDPTLQSTYVYIDETHNFFSSMLRAPKRSDGGSTLFHGDMNVSNIIFDDQFNVKAIVDWKFIKNGDPMVDVAYFCMMFLRPEDYGKQYKPINDHKLLISSPALLEGRILDEYQKRCIYSFSASVFLYAKSVCCLRLLSIMQAAITDNFRGHESGDYKDNTAYPQLVMDCLTAAGGDYYRRSGTDSSRH